MSAAMISRSTNIPYRKPHSLVILIAIACVTLLASCQSIGIGQRRTVVSSRAIASTPAPISVIPSPYSIARLPGSLDLPERVDLRIDSSAPESVLAAKWFAEIAQRSRDLHVDIQTSTSSTAADSAAIVFRLDPQLVLEDDGTDEGYSLDVDHNRASVVARNGHGLFNGAVTLWQLLNTEGAEGPVRLPCLHIEDHPRFAWRGLMLDSARHFQSPQFVKQFIDSMAMHKFNVLHWHLTDDQGWRIQIKKYPRLTEIGAWRQPAGAAGFDAHGNPVRVGGFYTQEEIRDIVRYAQERYVTIVPEIEMPGHAQAAIAAYPQLGVTGRNPGVSANWGVHTYLYNVDNSTFSFLEDVLTETMALFPSPYIHIGGDEAAKDQWQASRRVQQRMRELGVKNEAGMQSFLIHRIEKFLNAHGRKLIGWDDILEGGLPPQATVMSWRGSKGAIEAARLGHDVVLSPDPDLYFDHLSGDLPDEPAGRPSVISLKNVYDFKPVPVELDAEQAKHVLGAQANIWSEYLPTDASIEYAAYPRAAALAEVLWSPANQHDWQSFLQRLVTMEARYRRLGIDYAQSAFAVRIDAAFATADKDRSERAALVTLSNQAAFGAIRYTLDGSAPTAQSMQYDAPFETPARGVVRANAFEGDQALADPRQRELSPSALLRRSSSELASCHPDQGVNLRLPDESAADRYHHIYRVEIFDPCWLWPKADLDGVEHIQIAIARLPYNFQLWKDIKSVKSNAPLRYPSGELQVRRAGCEGELIATLSLAPVLQLHGVTSVDAKVAPRQGQQDLCFKFATGKHDPLWVIDSVQLLPEAKH